MYKHSCAILPCGKLTIKTGNITDYGLITAFWENSTLEVWKKENGNMVVISTAGDLGKEVGKNDSFQHDQTGRHLFSAVKVAQYPVASYADLANLGLKTVRIYCYK